MLPVVLALVGLQMPEPVAWASSVPVAIREARRLNRPVLVASSVNLTLGERVVQTLETDLPNLVRSRFVPVQVWTTADLRPVLDDGVLTAGVTVMVLEPSGQVLMRMGGFTDSADLREALDLSLWARVQRGRLDARRQSAKGAGAGRLAIIYGLAGEEAAAAAMIRRMEGAPKATQYRAHMALADHYRSQYRYREAKPHLARCEALAATSAEKCRAYYRTVTGEFRLGNLQGARRAVAERLKKPLESAHRELLERLSQRLGTIPGAVRRTL